MHGASQDIAINSEPPGVTVAIEETRGRFHDTLTTPATAKLSRKLEYLLIAQKPEYQPAAFLLKRSTSGWYYGNVALWSVPGFIVDHANGARFNLTPGSVHVVLTQSPEPHIPRGTGAIPIDAVPFLRLPPPAAWSDNACMKLAFSIPEGNWVYYDSPEKLISRFGFLGLTISAEYYPKKHQFYSVSLGVMTDFMLPFPAPVDACVFEGTGQGLVQLQTHRELGKYVVGTGIHWLFGRYRRYRQGYCVDEPPVIEEQVIAFQTIGPSLSAQRRVANHWYITFDFLPSILQRENDTMTWKYSHTAYFSIAYKMTLAHM
jgi:hypothetical protein